MRLFVVVQGDEIIVTSETGFRAEYWKRPNHPQLKVRRCTNTENHELLAQAEAHRGETKIKSRLIAELDPDEWDLPPKPKWMRWRTYNRYVERYDAYEAILDYGIAELAAKLLSK